MDSAGVTILSYTLAQLDAAPAFEADTAALLTVGAADGPPGTTLNQVRVLIGRPDGGFIVADDGGTVLRAYDATGRYLGHHGQQGSGPGEYRRIEGLSWLPGDSLVVFDRENARMSVLDSGLRFTRSQRLPQALARSSLGPGASMFVHGLGGPGAVALASAPLDPASILASADPRPRIEQDTLALVILRPNGDELVTDTLRQVSGGSVLTQRLPNGFRRSSVNFSSYPYLVGNQTGFALAHGSRLEVLRFDPEGRLRWIVRVPVEPRLVSSSDREPIERSFRERQPQPDGPPPAFADHHPLISGLELDGAGNTWVFVDSEISRQRGWIVMGPEGELRGWHARLPGSRLYLGTDFALAVTRSAEGIERVVKYPLRLVGDLRTP